MGIFNCSGKKEMAVQRYKMAVDARDKLNENYHKWMTFYYVANGAILVAITTLLSDKTQDKVPIEGIILLSLIGAFTCMIWNFSCKGYYYWSNNWINLIIIFEKEVFDEGNSVYGIFSKETVENEKPIWCLFGTKNISTPKLTLIFSFISFICWIIFALYLFLTQFILIPLLCKRIISAAVIIIIIIIYFTLPLFVKSRKDGQHKLI